MMQTVAELRNRPIPAGLPTSVFGLDNGTRLVWKRNHEGSLKPYVNDRPIWWA